MHFSNVIQCTCTFILYLYGANCIVGRMFQEKELEYASRYEEVVNRVEKEREKWRIQQAVSTHVEALRQIEQEL